MVNAKVALVTGGNRGIGYEVVRQLFKRGFCVVLASRNLEKGEKAVAELGGVSDRLVSIQMDVSDAESISRASQQFSLQFEHLDVLVNNAGILLDASESILSVSEEAIMETIDTNSLGPLRVTRTLLPFLKNAEDPRVINVSSLAGQLKNMGNWAPAYSISKTTLNAVTCLLSNELKSDGIKVNAVSPGWIRTEMGGPKAPGTLEEGANTIVWLATEAPVEITGQFLRDRASTDW